MSSSTWLWDVKPPRQKRFDYEDDWCGHAGGRNLKKKHNMRILGNRVLVKIDEAKNESPGGIVLPIPEESKTATVIAINPMSNPKSAVNPGDKVLVDIYAGTSIEIKGQTLTIVDEECILMVLD